jgi:SAM-dependent methyltransferase
MLEFPDDSFDVVYGGGILHHLEFERALSEVRRVLKPGGLMLFEEPLNINPVGKFVRWLTPKARTEDERPLQNAELNLCARGFAMKSRYVQFMSVPAGVLTGLLRLPPQNVVTRAAYAVDEGLLKVVPGIGRMYRHVVLMGNKPTAAH